MPGGKQNCTVRARFIEDGVVILQYFIVLYIDFTVKCKKQKHMYTTFLLEHLIYMNDNRAKSQLIFFFCKSGWLIRPEVLVDLRKKNQI